MIDLYYWPTPNGWKVSIALEELELPYQTIPVNISSGDQFSEAFLEVSPNAKMPAIVETLEWLFWQTANQGPMAGQLSHFVNYAPDGQDYGKKRYAGEYDRNLGVLERQLANQDYILGEFSIVDIIAFPWVLIAKPLGASLDNFPQVSAWRARIKDRPAVRRGVDLMKDQQNRGQHNAQNNSVLFNQSADHFKKHR
jgi:GST-like protein